MSIDDNNNYQIWERERERERKENHIRLTLIIIKHMLSVI